MHLKELVFKWTGTSFGWFRYKDGNKWKLNVAFCDMTIFLLYFTPENNLWTMIFFHSHSLFVNDFFDYFDVMSGIIGNNFLVGWGSVSDLLSAFEVCNYRLVSSCSIDLICKENKWSVNFCNSKYLHGFKNVNKLLRLKMFVIYN